MTNKTDRAGLWYYLSLAFGVFFIISGIFNFTEDIIGAILIILAGIVLVPITKDILKDKLNMELSKWRKIFLVLVLLTTASFLTNPSEINTTSNTINSNQRVQNSPKFINEDLYGILYQFTNPQSPMTDLQKKEEWKSYKGKYVKSSAIVDSISRNLLGKYVVLASELPKGQYDIGSDYAIFFQDSQKDKLLRLSKGDRIYFSGRLADYHTTFENLDIKDATLVSK